MDFAPTEEQLLVQRTARDAAERILLPRAAAILCPPANVYRVRIR